MNKDTDAGVSEEIMKQVRDIPNELRDIKCEKHKHTPEMVTGFSCSKTGHYARECSNRKHYDGVHGCSQTLPSSNRISREENNNLNTFRN